MFQNVFKFLKISKIVQNIIECPKFSKMSKNVINIIKMSWRFSLPGKYQLQEQQHTCATFLSRISCAPSKKFCIRWNQPCWHSRSWENVAFGFRCFLRPCRPSRRLCICRQRQNGSFLFRLNKFSIKILKVLLSKFLSVLIQAGWVSSLKMMHWPSCCEGKSWIRARSLLFPL